MQAKSLAQQQQPYYDPADPCTHRCTKGARACGRPGCARGNENYQGAHSRRIAVAMGHPLASLRLEKEEEAGQ